MTTYLAAEDLDDLLRERPSLLLAPGRSDRQEDQEPEELHLQGAFAAAVGSLSRGDQHVLKLYYLDGLSLEEAGRTLGVSANSYRRALNRANSSLRAIFVDTLTPTELQHLALRAQQVRRGRRELVQWLDQSRDDEPVELARSASHYVHGGRAASS